jgi:exoribonuclease R
MALVSKNESFRIGDQIKIRVKRASKETRQIDFELVRGERSGKRYKGRRKK